MQHPWDHKLYLLREISNGLNEIHEKGLVHRNFHSGNIVIALDFKIYITDLGLSKPANVTSEEQVFGVLPYIAPEVLAGRDYTQESDIYSFGMIAYEILSGYPPYCSKSHNELLAIRICRGSRLQFEIQIPRSLLVWTQSCWNNSSTNLPKAKELLSTLQVYENDYSKVNRDSEIFKQIDEADKYNERYKLLPEPKNPQAIYTSRLLHFIKKISDNPTLDETISGKKSF